MRKLLLVLGLAFPLLAANYPSPPPPDHYVRDLAGVIDSNYEDKINCLCRELEGATTAEMAVLTISSFEGEDPREYSTALGNYWGVGQADEDNGLVLVAAIDDRQVFTATGIGTEKILPDSVVERIYEMVLVPNFRQEDYGKGIYEAFELYASEISKHYEKKTKDREKTQTSHNPVGLAWWVYVLLGTQAVVLSLSIVSLTVVVRTKRGKDA